MDAKHATLSTRRRSRRKPLGKAAQYWVRLRFTLCIFGVIALIGIALEILGQANWAAQVQAFSWDLTTIQHGRIYAAWTGLFFSASPLDFYGMLVVLLLTVGALEYRRGPQVAMVGFFVLGPLASLITLLALWPLSNLGIEYVRVALFTPDLGSSTACFVCAGLFLAGEKGRWRNILLLAILAALIALFYQNAVYKIDHLDGYLIGLGAGAALSYWQKFKARQAGNQVAKYLAGAFARQEL